MERNEFIESIRKLSEIRPTIQVYETDEELAEFVKSLEKRDNQRVRDLLQKHRAAKRRGAE